MSSAKPVPEDTGLNKVIVHDDYIEVRVIGVQTLSSIRKVSRGHQKVLNDFRKQNKPILILCILKTKGPPSVPTFKEAIEVLERIRFDRIAFFGTTSDGEAVLVRVLIDAFKHVFDLEYFDDRKKAIEWLRELKKS